MFGRVEYAEQIALLDDEAARQQLEREERTCGELELMIMRRYGGREGLGNAARKNPIARELQQRHQAATSRRTELRRRVGQGMLGDDE